jgi:hypothetical protein
MNKICKIRKPLCTVLWFTSLNTFFLYVTEIFQVHAYMFLLKSELMLLHRIFMISPLITEYFKSMYDDVCSTHTIL